MLIRHRLQLIVGVQSQKWTGQNEEDGAGSRDGGGMGGKRSGRA